MFEPKRPAQEGEDQYSVRFELRDGKGRLLGEVGDWQSFDIKFSAEANDVEESELSIPGSSMWAKTAMRANRRVTLVHFFLYRAGERVEMWTGRVERAVRRKDGRQRTVTMELVSDKAWLQYILIRSAPFSALWLQAPKINTKFGSALYTMKQFIGDNLIRLQRDTGFILLDWDNAKLSTYQNNRSMWPQIQEFMPLVSVNPTHKDADTSPYIALSAQMTPAAELIQDACKDYNLLPTARFLVPGRGDPVPDNFTLIKPGVVIDIEDKELARARGQKKNIFEQITEELSVFVRGLFGRYDSPPAVESTDFDSLIDFFGNQSTDPWVIFRDSDEHWQVMEDAAYAPTTTLSVAGGKSHEFINDFIDLIIGTILNMIPVVGGALSYLWSEWLGKTVDDILMAYQAANDEAMRDFLGDFAFFENYGGQGTTAYSYDSVQQLRQMRWDAIGYKTATFEANASSVAPFRPFEDFNLLDPVGWEDDLEGTIETERVKQMRVSGDEDGNIRFEVRIGESDKPEYPWEIQSRRNDMFRNAITAALNQE